MFANLYDYAKSELEIAFPDKEDEMQRRAVRDILELIKVFSDQEHSGMSAPYVLSYFDRLVRWKPITPLTGEDNEWWEPYNYGDNCSSFQQNKRYGSIFRENGDNSTAYDIDGRVFMQKDGITFTSSESSIPVSFPYEVPDEPEIVHVDS